MIKTNLSKSDIVKLGSQIFGYNLEKTGGFPFAFTLDNVNGGDVIIPVTLSENVKELHEWLYDEPDYTPSQTVEELSQGIINMTGYGEDYIEHAKNIADMANPNIGAEVDEG